jgi:hypothetical protein
MGLFGSYLATEGRMIMQMVRLLGRPPDPWLDACKEQMETFD